MAVNKPEGLLSITDGYDRSLPNLSNLLRQDHPGLLTVHRLDKDTSGLMLFAKDVITHRSLSMAFTERRVEKTYTAICAGVPDWQKRTMENPLLVDGDRQHRTIIDRRGKTASTTAELVKSSAYNCLLEITPHSGYTHQIRAHLAGVGVCVLGDRLYQAIAMQQSAFLRDQYNFNQQGIQRMYLHASTLAITHPATGQQLTLTAPLSRAFQKKIVTLFTR